MADCSRAGPIRRTVGADARAARGVWVHTPPGACPVRLPLSILFACLPRHPGWSTARRGPVVRACPAPAGRVRVRAAAAVALSRPYPFPSPRPACPLARRGASGSAFPTCAGRAPSCRARMRATRARGTQFRTHVCRKWFMWTCSCGATVRSFSFLDLGVFAAFPRKLHKKVKNQNRRPRRPTASGGSGGALWRARGARRAERGPPACARAGARARARVRARVRE